MHVFELHYPGATAEGISAEDTMRIWSLFGVLENHLADAALGLWLFEQAVGVLPTPAARRRTDDERMKAETALMNTPQVQAAQEALRRDSIAGKLTPKQWSKAMAGISEAARLHVRRQQWAAGQLPDTYQQRLPHIHAHTVLYALHGIGKALRALSQISGLPAGIAAAWQAHEAALPNLTDVRNSAQHIDERAQQCGPRNRTMTLQPITNGAIEAPTGNVLIMGVLINRTRLAYTAADGTCREIEISTATVTAAQTAIQQAINAITWHSFGRNIP